MKNSLESFLERNGISENHALNLLQGAGIVSDNCVTAADVAEDDTRDAVFYLAGILKK